MIRITFASIFIFVVVSETAHAAAACTSPVSACTEWVSASQAPGRTLVYRTHPLDVRNEAVTRALVVVHGQGRDADVYFRTAIAGAFLAGALDNTLVVAPRFASRDGRCRDRLEADELNWGCIGPQSWRNGGAALGNADVTSFELVDAVVQRLARKEVFPNLRRLVVAGPSAGGQYAARYAMANQAHERSGVVTAYVVANPSSYTYPDGLRPTRSALPPRVAALPPGYQAPPPRKTPAPFVPFADASNCTTFDDWPYGLQRRSGYSARFSPEQLVKQLVERRTTFLLGAQDILPVSGFDSSCPAMAQGPTRLARGLAYAKHVNETHGAQHATLVIAACGHSARCMFTSDRALPVLFPND
jgi:hypothetical protein